MSDKSVVLTDSASAKSTTLPVVTGTLGDPALDIAKLNKDTGYYTFDPGFTNTVSTRSAITFIDGDKGVLLYRGYPIEQLAKQSSFLEVAYLLLNGELPTATEFGAFGEGYIRISFANSEENLSEALRRIDKANRQLLHL